MNEIQNYDDAVKVIKTAILESQYEAAKSVNERQLMLYYGIGKYISRNSREGFWGKGAIEAISEQLDKELPGLKGFSARNLRNMRTFYEEWSILDQEKLSSESGSTHVLADASAKTNNDASLQIWQTRLPNSESFPLADFLHIGFSHHTLILSKVKSYEERIFYIKRVVAEKLSVDALKLSIAEDAFHHQGSLPNNFIRTISAGQQALKAISTFKDEYLLDYINVEELDVRDSQDIDEKMVEKLFTMSKTSF